MSGFFYMIVFAIFYLASDCGKVMARLKGRIYVIL